MRRRRSAWLVMTFAFVFGVASGGAFAVAGHLDGGCPNKYDVNDWIYHHGNDNRNHCYGNDGKDMMYGYAAGDDLQGGPGEDILRGAHGNDDLTDGQGEADRDGTCHGQGDDYTNVRDNDSRDEVYFTDENDYDLDRWDGNTGGPEPDDYKASTPYGCPFAD